MPTSALTFAILLKRFYFFLCVYLCFFVDLKMLVQYLQRSAEGVW